MSRFTLRSSLGRVRGLGSAREGTQHWLWQRLTAVGLIPLTLWFIYSLITLMAEGSIESVRAFFLSSFNAVATVLLLLALFYHAMLGLQVILEDYVHSPRLHITLIILNKFTVLVLTLVAIAAVMKMHFFTLPPQVFMP